MAGPPLLTTYASGVFGILSGSAIHVVSGAFGNRIKSPAHIVGIGITPTGDLHVMFRR